LPTLRAAIPPWRDPYSILFGSGYAGLGNFRSEGGKIFVLLTNPLGVDTFFSKIRVACPGGKAMQVKNQMSRKVVTIPPNTSILRAIEIMRDKSIRHLPVVEEGELVGLVTEGDLRQASLLSLVDKVSIDDVMIKKPVTISPEASIEEAARLVYRHRIGGLPVVVGRKLVGILTIVDILAAFIQLLGILKSSSRIDMILGGKPHAFEEVSAVLRNHRAEIISVGMSNHKDRKKRVYYFRVGKCPVKRIVNELEKKGYKVLSVVE
jgi:acetoin utilization protein AcuB